MYYSLAFIILINVDFINHYFFSLVSCFTGAESGGLLKRAENKNVTANHTTTPAATIKAPENGGGTDPASLINHVFFIIVIGAYMYVQL